MENKIVEIICKVCEDESIKENLEIDLLETEKLDSLGFINLITMLEEEFDIEIQPTQVAIDTWRTVSGIKKLVESLIHK